MQNEYYVSLSNGKICKNFTWKADSVEQLMDQVLACYRDMKFTNIQKLEPTNWQSIEKNKKIVREVANYLATQYVQPGCTMVSHAERLLDFIEKKKEELNGNIG